MDFNTEQYLNQVIESEGLAFCKALYKTRSLINEFANEENINGTYIDKVLYVNKNFSKFCDKKYFKNNSRKIWWYPGIYLPLYHNHLKIMYHGKNS